jgi:hypothetical protein
LGGRPRSGERGQVANVDLHSQACRGSDTSSWKNHQQGFRSDPAELDVSIDPRRLPRHARRWAYELRDSLRPLWREVAPRLADCGHKRASFTPQVILRADGRAYFGGLVTCGNVHGCPVCALAIKTRRALEVTEVVEAHAAAYGRATIYLVTATVRHELGHDLKVVRKGVARARKRMRQGRAWQDWKRSVGYVGEVNAVEVTHGENGWHPHHHAVMMFKRPLSEADVHWMKERWAACVAAALGEEHRPDYEHGLDVRQCHKADYLAKLGLELNEAMGAKRSANGHRSYLQIAQDYAATRSHEDGELLREHFRAFFGSKQLNWSRGLRKRYGLGKERPDEELADEALVTEPIFVEQIDAADWDAIRHIPQAKTFVLEAAETGGRPAMRDALESLRRHPGARWQSRQRRPRRERPPLPELPPNARYRWFRDASWQRNHAAEFLDARARCVEIIAGRVDVPVHTVWGSRQRRTELKPARMAEILVRVRESRFAKSAGTA